MASLPVLDRVLGLDRLKGDSGRLSESITIRILAILTRVSVSTARNVTKTRRQAVPARPLRVALLAGLVTVLTVAGHSAADGALPGPLAWVVVPTVAGAFTRIAYERRRNVLSLALIVVVLQVVLHAVLVIVGGHHGSLAFTPSPSMVATHLVAAFVIALLVARADHLIDAWIELGRRCLAVAVRACEVPTVSRGSWLPAMPRITMTMDVIGACLTRRGPPAIPSVRLGQVGIT